MSFNIEPKVLILDLLGIFGFLLAGAAFAGLLDSFLSGWGQIAGLGVGVLCIAISIFGKQWVR